MRTSSQPIGVFDSGVGGLSILRELKHLLPNENFIFLADQLYFPYGEKSKKELIARSFKISDFFVKHHNIKIMIIACNTATCHTIDSLRKKYSFPIVGTVPAIKLAAQKTKSRVVAIISTPATSKSRTLKKLIKDNCENIGVLNIGCKNLADMVDQGKLNGAKIDNLLFKYLNEVRNSKADYLVLGSTHYPFLVKNIRKILGSRIKPLDSGQAIAKHTKNLLTTNNLVQDNQKFSVNKSKRSQKTLYFTTGNPTKFSKVSSKLLGNTVQATQIKI